MLYKNGVPYRMSEKEVEALEAKFTFPIYLRYPNVLKKFNKLNQTYDKPAGINIPLRSIVREENTTIEWRWAQQDTVNPQGQKKYMPRVIPFQGDWAITDLDIDLLYYLYYKSPYCVNGAIDEKQRKKPYFEIEDLRIAATLKVRDRKMRSRVATLIDDDEMGLPETKLRALARAYFVPHVDKLSLDQVRVVLDLEVRKDKRDGLQRFIDMSGATEMIQLRGKIRSAIDQGIVRFMPKVKTWVFINEDETMDPICKVNKIEPQAGLVEFYGGDREFAQRLDAELEGRGAIDVVSKIVKSEGEITNLT